MLLDFIRDMRECLYFIAGGIFMTTINVLNFGDDSNGKAKSFSAIFPIVLRNKDGCTEILLHRRQNTGYQAGKWDIAGSGHVNKNETAQDAVIRECKEEIGINIKVEDLTFAHLSHRLSNVGSHNGRTYYDIYFVINAYSGIPRIMETDKCSELTWFSINNLPEDIIPCRKQDIQNYINNILYSEKIEN